MFGDDSDTNALLAKPTGQLVSHNQIHGKIKIEYKSIYPAQTHKGDIEIEIENKAGKNILKEDHKFDASIYANDEVRSALEKLFHCKCAYCECPLEEIGWNVEHFRPKGRVFEREDHPGYYWLAYKWENLYPSCIPCNQLRKHKPTWDDPHKGETGGKADQFPLQNEKTRAMTRDSDLIRENHLLLDPCKDKPEEYLTLDIYGQIQAMNNN